MFTAPENADVLMMDGVLVTDASDLGLPPGHWPRHIRLGGRVYDLKQIDTSDENEVLCARYEVRIGTARLTVFND